MVPPKPKSRIELEQNKIELNEIVEPKPETTKVLQVPESFEVFENTTTITEPEMPPSRRPSLERIDDEPLSVSLCENLSKPVAPTADQVHDDNEHLPQMDAVSDCQDATQQQSFNSNTMVQNIITPAVDDNEEDNNTNNENTIINDNVNDNDNGKIDKQVNEPKSPKSSEDSCEFIIYQRQYSMRAIMLDDVTPTNLGLMLCGGLDSKRKEVTVSLMIYL